MLVTGSSEAENIISIFPEDFLTLANQAQTRIDALAPFIPLVLDVDSPGRHDVPSAEEPIDYGGTSWIASAYCSDKPTNLFFPSDGVGVEIARKVCADCVVKMPCLEYALRERIDHGVWGGTSERERKRILKRRQQEAQR